MGQRHFCKYFQFKEGLNTSQRIKYNREYDKLLQSFYFLEKKEDLLETGNKSGFNNCVYWRPVFTKNCEIEMKRAH